MLVGLLAGIQQDLNRVRDHMVQQLKNDQSSLDRLISYMMQKQGKMIRPALVILSGKLCHATVDELIPIGAGVEMLHMATLIHDDIIDEAKERRGLTTVNKRYGSRSAVLLGDYFYAKSLQQFTSLNQQGFNLVANVISNLVKGEFIQYDNSFKKDQGYSEYWKLIDHKTAYFIASCCQLGAFMGQSTTKEEKALQRYGQNLGMAFQICDDLLDFSTDTSKLGKNTNQDVANGIYTLPILHALQKSTEQEKLRTLLEKDLLGTEDLAELTQILTRAGSLRYAHQVAEKLCLEARDELKIFPNSYERRVLESLAQFNLKREC